MLTECSECGHDVSTNADKCPNCGAPVNHESGGPIPAAPQTVQVIERTSKRYKAQVLWGLGLLVLGCIISVSSLTHGSSEAATCFGGFCAVGGLIWMIGAKIAGWWHHG
jgi:uncharacterized membrane protein YvbJ